VDSAEQWLLEYDPEYAVTSRGWKHVIGGTYELPREEDVARSEHVSVEKLLESGARAVHGVPTRACDGCGIDFEAERRDGNRQRFCSNACKQKAYRRRRYA